MEKFEEVERSLIKKFRSTIWRKFVKGVSEYNMIKAGDKIAVCISGGKDSMLLAKCIQELQKHWLVKFDAEFIVMDPGYNKANRELIESNAKLLNIPIKVFESDIFESVENITSSPCYLCARMRRGCLYEYAASLGCNKIALGHHFDDAIETILISMFYGSEYKTMMPKLKSTSHKGMELIRPMYLIKEEDIIKWRDYHELQFLRCACKLIEKTETGELESKRKDMKELIKKLREDNDNVDINIFRSIHKVNLDTVIGYKLKGKYVSFLDDYDEE